MGDFLLDIGDIKWARKAITAAGIPLPMPQRLDRDSGPIVNVSLEGKLVLAPQARSDIVTTLTQAGAELQGEGLTHGLLYDARAAASIDDLVPMYAFFHEHIRRLAPNGRVLIVARTPAGCATAEASAVASAATGFAKSTAKEIGKRGATANVIYVDSGADDQIPGVLRFVMSRRSAYVDGQAFVVSAAKEKPVAGWEKSLAGKVALVTGAARGIGEITARRLAEEGAHVLVLDVPPAREAAEKLATELGGTALALDITQADAPAAIVAAAKKLGALNIVVNNAGVTRDKTLANMSEELWRTALDVNLKAALRITEASLKTMPEGGRAVFLSSIAGIAGNLGQSNYGAAKAGLMGATRALASAFAAKGCTVNAVAPGFIETQMTAAIPIVTREAGRRLSALGQGGQTLDVAELITFLASPAAAGINGQVIRVCGLNFIGA